MRHKPKHLVEYALFASVAGLLRILPLRAALSLAWLAAAGTHFIGRVKVERTRRRIRQVLGASCSKRKVRRIAWISWRNLFFNLVEALRFSMLTQEKIRKQPLFRFAPQMQQIISSRNGGGIILATPHMGNWEIAGIAADFAGIPIFAIATRQKNPLIDRYINRMRQSFSLEILLKGHNAGKGVVERLRQGKVLAILPDIGAKWGGITVDYLNNQAAIAPGAAAFAQMTGCPIYPAVVRRIGWTRHDAVLLPPIEPDPAADREAGQQRIMQELMSALSAEILKSPEQYFWYNKRWVLNKEP